MDLIDLFLLKNCSKAQNGYKLAYMEAINPITYSFYFTGIYKSDVIHTHTKETAVTLHE